MVEPFLPVPLFACGFCVAGPTLIVLPLLPVWLGVFAIWCFTLGKYDPPRRKVGRQWLISTPFIGLAGAIVSIEIWTAALLFWSVGVIRRIVELGSIQQSSQTEVTTASPMQLRARSFHVQTLIVLALAMAFKIMLHSAGIGIRL